MENARDWAWETFGAARLGDARRVSRLVTLAEAAAEKPGCRLTDVCRNAAEREGGYRWLERGKVQAEALSQAIVEATARRCAGLEQLIIPIDQTGISVVDRQGKKPIGRTVFKDSARQGLQVMTALAMDRRGAPLGVIGQKYWRRADKVSLKRRKDRRRPEQRESILWELALDQCMASLEQYAAVPRPWFQLDRGADSNRVLLWANDHRARADVTFRSSSERTLDTGKPLKKSLRRQKPGGRLDVFVPASRGRGRQRPARIARCDVRFAEVVIAPSKHHERIRVSVVHVREQRRHKRRLEWWLITTRSVRSLKQALEIVRGYTFRWKIEGFHYAWKTGACDVESSQLHSTNAFQCWATVLSAVAARVERLKHLSRTEPDLPFTVELTRYEVDAAIILSRTNKHRVGDELTIGQAVRLIGIIGGHMGYPSAGHPGTKVIARGFERVLAAAQVAEQLRGSG